MTVGYIVIGNQGAMCTDPRAPGLFFGSTATMFETRSRAGSAIKATKRARVDMKDDCAWMKMRIIRLETNSK